MDTNQTSESFEDDKPFVNDGCGDSMWDDVLSQPPLNPALRPPLPPFTLETARQKVQMAEDAWNSRDPHRVSLAYSEDTEWRNRTEFINGRDEVQAFLERKWARELDYRLKKELWGFRENRMAVRFEYDRVAGAMARRSRSMVPQLRQRAVPGGRCRSLTKPG